mmetsp:Transcript_34903/g.74456  ORF Transcript_34903/g.74456 Transcript_34903/m.74456 type:complete len:246 (+) Transcript_34903:63-800(+)
MIPNFDSILLQPPSPSTVILGRNYSVRSRRAWTLRSARLGPVVPSPSPALELVVRRDAGRQALPLHPQAVLHRLLLPQPAVHGGLSLPVRDRADVERLLLVQRSHDLLQRPDDVVEGVDLVVVEDDAPHLLGDVLLLHLRVRLVDDDGGEGLLLVLGLFHAAASSSSSPSSGVGHAEDGRRSAGRPPTVAAGDRGGVRARSLRRRRERRRAAKEARGQGEQYYRGVHDVAGSLSVGFATRVDGGA